MDEIRLSKSILLGRHYHPQSCCTFVIVYVPGRTWINQKDYDGSDFMLNGYAVGWVPHGIDKIPEPLPFKSYQGAHSHFMAYRGGTPPAKQPYTRDFQQKLCYEWESANIKGGNRRISRKRAESLIGKICREFGVVAPSFNFKKGQYQDYAFFQTTRHEIGGDWRMLNTANIVHECAHLVDIHLDNNDFVMHGPSFVRRLIELSACFIPANDEAALLRSAERSGLLGLPEITHILEPPANPIILPEPSNENAAPHNNGTATIQNTAPGEQRLNELPGNMDEPAI